MVIFIGLLEIAIEGQSFNLEHLAGLFLREAGGGALLGLAAGMFVYWLLRSVDNYQVEILLSLALVAGGYTLADALHLSAPIAMVVAGLLIGNHGRSFAMSQTTAEHLDLFWELVDEILNAMLFVLLGFEVLVLTFSKTHLVAGLLMIPAVLLARLISVGLPAWAMRHWQGFAPGDVHSLNLGRSAGRHFRGDGLIAAQPGAGRRRHGPRHGARDHLRGGRILNSRTRTHDRPPRSAMAR